MSELFFGGCREIYHPKLTSDILVGLRDSVSRRGWIIREIGLTRLTQDQEKEFWNRLGSLALEESLLSYCNRPDNFARNAREAIRACVTKEALDKADNFFSSKVTTFVSGWVKGGLKCGPEPLEARGILGVNVNKVESSTAPNGGEIKAGVLVLGVIPGSPAAAAGIKKDDLIISMTEYQSMRRRQ